MLKSVSVIHGSRKLTVIERLYGPYSNLVPTLCPNPSRLFSAISAKIEKPLVIFEENRITKETLTPAEIDLFIAEGTYTTLLNHADYHVFIDRTYEDTRAHRTGRGRDPLDEMSERFLEIEHSIISKHRSLAEIVVNEDYSVTWVGK